MNNRSRLTYITLFLIVLVAFFLRVYKLGSDASYSTDEVTTVTNSMQPLSEIFKLENRTPLQALWIAFGARVLGLGYGEFAVYFLSVLVSVIAVIVIYQLADYLFDQHTGLLAAFMLAFSVYNIYWSRSARYYALMVLLSTCAFLCLYWALVTNRKRAWLLYALFRILSLYDHLTAVWVFAGECIYAFLYIALPWVKKVWDARGEKGFLKNEYRGLRHTHLRDILGTPLVWLGISVSIILLAYTPVWYPTMRDIYLGNSVVRIGDLSSEQMAPREVRSGQLQPLLGGGWQGPLLVFEQLSGWIKPLHLLYLLLFFLGVLFSALERQWRPLSFILTIMLLPFALSVFIKSYSLVLDGRYLISLLPLYYTLGAQGVEGAGQLSVRLARPNGKLKKYIPLATTAILLALIAAWNMTRIPLTFRNTGHNWRAVARFLAQNAQPDDLIVVNSIPQNYKALQYYLPGYNIVQNDPRVSYDTMNQEEDGFWLVFEPGITLQSGLRYWLDKVKATVITFASGWYPDIDHHSELAPAQNWDLVLGYVSREDKTEQNALRLHETWLADAEANNPGDVRQHLSMAEAYQRYDHCGKAINEYSLALEEGYVNEQLASFIYEARATCWSEAGKTDLAIADYQRAISQAPWRKEPYELLVNMYFQTDRWDEAASLIRAANKANPTKAWPHVLLGDFYRRRGSADEAIAEYKRAISVEPGDRAAYQLLSEVFMDQGEYHRVISLYKDAMQTNQWFGWPHFQLAQFYQAMGKVSEAMVEFQKASELQPELTPAISDFFRNARWDLSTSINLIHAYSDQGDLLRWLGNSWARPSPEKNEVLVGHSSLTVDGKVHPNQLLFHPYSDKENTYIEFAVPQNYFTNLNVGYGMADRAVDHSNGVSYTIQVRKKGEEAFIPLLDEMVHQNVWEERSITLLPLWGEDLEFRMKVNARDDLTNDWLQTTVELAPPLQPIWDLSSNLRNATSSPEGDMMQWRGDAFYNPDGNRVIGPSDQPVGGENQAGQFVLHPYSSETDSTLVFHLQNQPYGILKTWFGLADGALPGSNGVDYTVSVSSDGGQTYTDLVQKTVTENKWRSEIVELPSIEDFWLKVSSSARGDHVDDWLQVKLDIIPLREEKVNN